MAVHGRRSPSVAVGRRWPPPLAVAFGGRSGLFFAHRVGLRAWVTRPSVARRTDCPMRPERRVRRWVIDVFATIDETALGCSTVQSQRKTQGQEKDLAQFPVEFSILVSHTLYA